MIIEKRDLFIKKLLYKSCYRGCKETDLVIGSFAKENLPKMTDQELIEFGKIIELPDSDIYDWFTSKKPIPQNYNSELMQKLIKFELVKK